MRYLRNLGRRKARTTLTILGITIGIWALVVFGSMANKINALVEGGSSYYADKLTLSDSSGSMGGFSSAPMSLATADLVRAVDGVDAVAPAVMMLMDDSRRGDHGRPADDHRRRRRRGRGPRDVRAPLCAGPRADGRGRGHSTSPSSAPTSRASTTSTSATRSSSRACTFEVVGVLEPTLTAPDQAASVPLQAAQQLFVDDAAADGPRLGSRRPICVTTMTVYPKPGVDPEVARRPDRGARRRTSRR